MTLPFKFEASIASAAFIAALAVGAAGAAFAQPAEGGGRAAFTQACGADIQKFCPNMQPGPDMRTCVRSNEKSFSDPCKAFLDRMRSMRQQHSQGGGAAPQ
jgi:hypothetical protein